MTKKVNKLYSIQLLRAVAALMVLMHHTQNLAKALSGVGPKEVVVTAAGVDIFFVISGFVMVLITYHSAYDIKKVSGFFLDRIFRIWPLYAFFTLLTFALSFKIIPNWPSDTGYFLKSLFLILDVRPQTQGSLFPLLFQGWTLRYEFVFYLIFGVCLLFTKSRYFLAIFGIYCLIFLASYFHGSLFQKFIYGNGFIIVEFIFGICIAMVLMNVEKIEKKWLLPISSALAICVVLLLLQDYKLFEVKGFLRMIHWGIPAALIVYFSLLIEKSVSLDNPLCRALSSVGDYSFSIYLNHILVINLVRGVSLKYNILNDGVVDYGLIVLAVVTLSILFGGVTYYLIEKPCIRAGKKITRVFFRRADTVPARST